MLGQDPAGRPVRARGGLPGEVVDVAVEHWDRAGRAHGTVSAVGVFSPHRVSTPCPVFLRCGGCDHLHAALDWQREAKRQAVVEGLGVADGAVAALPDTKAFQYRALCKYVVEGDQVGAYARRSHDVVDTAGCVVHDPRGDALADRVRAALRDGSLAPGYLRYLVVRVSASTGAALVVAVLWRIPPAPWRAALEAIFWSQPEVGRFDVQVHDAADDVLLRAGAGECVFERAQVFERLNGLFFPLVPEAFGQVNPAAAAALYRWVVKRLPRAEPGRWGADLYAGSGGIAVHAAFFGGHRVRAVEAGEASVRALRAAAERNGRGHQIEARQGTVEAELGAVLGGAPGWLTLNPPRKGLSKAVAEAIAQHGPPDLVYVSCSIKTLRRDLDVLEAGGYRVRAVQPFDLFPHTRHVETVVALRRDS